MIQIRLAKGIDKYLMTTQYGFREDKSTADAIHIVRRLAHRGFTIQDNMHMALLDWGKAFDNSISLKINRSFTQNEHTN